MSEDRCKKCNKKFNLFNWKHKCNVCRSVVCSDCLSYGVCEDCHSCTGCNSITPKKSLTEIGFVENSLFSEPVYQHDLCPKCYEKYQNNIENWVPGTKEEYLDGYTIKEIGQVRIPDECDDIGQIEEQLKNEVAVLGGNSYIRFHWYEHAEHDAQSLSRIDEDGDINTTISHSSTKSYTGHAVAVIAKKEDS